MVGAPSCGATLAWEAKAAIVAFSLLALQQVHDGYLFCLGESGLGLPKLQSASVILFTLYLTLGIGLAKGAKWAWWLSLILIGGMAALHLRDTLEPIRGILYREPRQPANSSIRIICGTTEPPDYFRAVWLISQNALLGAIPILLMLGRLRQKLVGNNRPHPEAPIP